MASYVKEFANHLDGCIAGNLNYTGPNLNNTWPFTCDVDKFLSINTLFDTVSFLSLVVLVGLSRRINHKTPPKDCCWGHPGYLIPLNMLDGYEYRLAFCAAFGAMTFDLFDILWNPYVLLQLYSGSIDADMRLAYPAITILIRLFLVAINTIRYYPFFFALSTDFKFVGGILGIILVVARILLLKPPIFVDFPSGVFFSTCISTLEDPLNSAAIKYDFVIRLWPCMVCLIILSGQYVLQIAECIKKKSFGRQSNDRNMSSTCLVRIHYHGLNTTTTTYLSYIPRKLWAKFGFRRVPGFRFPTRVLATFTVTVLLLYQILYRVAFLVIYVLAYLRETVKCLEEVLPFDLFQYVEPYVTLMLKYVRVSVGLWNVTLTVNSLLAIIYVYLMCITYRQQTLRVYRGDRRLFPAGWQRQSNHGLVATASRHAGLQIAYTLWGFVIIQIFTFLVLMALAFVIFVPVIDFQDWSILNLIFQTLIVTLLLNQLIIIIQLLCVRLFFVQDKINPTDAQPPLAIDNPRAWYNLSFVFFFWNLFLGAISALMRILKGIVFGVFFIPRVDRPVLMKGFETLDNGFSAFLSLVSVINAHDHPVVKVFVKVLDDGVKKTREQASKENQAAIELEVRTPVADLMMNNFIKPPGLRNTPEGTKRAKHYWSLAYTLINNPELLKYRKVELDENDMSFNGKKYMSRHKIALAAHRKKQGQKTSDIHDYE